MAMAAVPGYLGDRFDDASPGMRFGMYLAIWQSGFTRKEKPVTEATWRSIKMLSPRDQKLMKALALRQEQQAGGVPDQAMFCLSGQAVSPFTTGLGNEHPLENGFAFLNPYGLPYLPGSGIKGVLRAAARELASGEWGDRQGWSQEMIDALFGPLNADNEARRGALGFWDAIPQLPGDQLNVEIMTPHQSHYFRAESKANAGSSETPHDSGQPNPINFLTLPPRTGFGFFVQCDRELLKHTAPQLCEGNAWKTLLRSAFDHAFDWVGFGAKTAVGYGQMTVDRSVENRRAEEEKQRRFAEMEPVDQALHKIRKVWDAEKAINRTQAGGPLDNAITEQIKAAVEWEEADRRRLAEECRQALKWLGKKPKKIREKLAPLDLPDA